MVWYGGSRNLTVANESSVLLTLLNGIAKYRIAHIIIYKVFLVGTTPEVNLICPSHIYHCATCLAQQTFMSRKKFHVALALLHLSFNRVFSFFKYKKSMLQVTVGPNLLIDELICNASIRIHFYHPRNDMHRIWLEDKMFETTLNVSYKCKPIVCIM